MQSRVRHDLATKQQSPQEKSPGAECPSGRCLGSAAIASLSRQHSQTIPRVPRVAEFIESVPILRDFKAEPGCSQLMLLQHDWPCRCNTNSQATCLSWPSQGKIWESYQDLEYPGEHDTEGPFLSLSLFSCSVVSDSCNPMGCSLPGSSVHAILQARIGEWLAISFSRGSSQPRNRTWVSCIASRFFTNWARRDRRPTSILRLSICVFEPVLPYAAPNQTSRCYSFSHRNFNHSLQNSLFGS